MTIIEIPGISAMVANVKIPGTTEGVTCTSDFWKIRFHKKNLISPRRRKKMESINEKLARRICDTTSDGYDDEELREETEEALKKELCLLPDDGFVKNSMISLCERIENLEFRLECEN
jgi:hypothetical protein